MQTLRGFKARVIRKGRDLFLEVALDGREQNRAGRQILGVARVRRHQPDCQYAYPEFHASIILENFAILYQ
jgi:hypothetical protein